MDISTLKYGIAIAVSAGFLSTSNAANPWAPALAGSSEIEEGNVDPSAADIAKTVGLKHIPPLEELQPATPPLQKSEGLISGGTFNLLLRNYFGYLSIHDGGHRTGWIQSARLQYESGYTPGILGVGFNISPFAAVKLNGGNGARNMVHVGPESSAPNEKSWAYPGEYAIKARFLGLQLRYGLQTIINPFLKPYDNRSLPPTFKGLSLVQAMGANLSLKAGSFDATNARGMDQLRPLTTSYSGISFNRLVYAGFEWERQPDTKMTIYASQAQDLWNQYYASVSQNTGSLGGMKWLGRLDVYRTQESGRKLQGIIDNTASSISFTGRRGASSLTLAFQRIFSDQFFDFTQETSGIYLANAMGNDFNAPHEKSVQLRYKFDGGAAGVPGFTVMMWGIFGWGADGSVEASRYAGVSSQFHSLYWKNGRPIGEGHEEYGFNPVYTFQSGALKGLRILLVLTLHNVSKDYPSKTFRDWRLMADMPLKMF